MERIENAPGEWGPRIAAGGYINKDGEVLSGRNGTSPAWKGAVCHGFIQDNEMFKKSMVFFNTQKETKKTPVNNEGASSCYTRKVSPQEAAEAFTKWMCEESPWRDYILNDDWRQVVHGGAIIDTKACGRNNLLAICKLLRTKYEDTWRVKTWHDLTQKGVHPMVALIVSQCVHNNLQGSNYGGGKYFPYHTHNSCFYAPLNEEQMEALFQDPIPKCDTNWTCAAVLKQSECRESPYFNLAGVQTKKVKVPDGWGGYIMKDEPGNMDDYIESLKELERKFRK